MRARYARTRSTAVVRPAPSASCRSTIVAFSTHTASAAAAGTVSASSAKRPSCSMELLLTAFPRHASPQHAPTARQGAIAVARSRARKKGARFHGHLSARCRATGTAVRSALLGGGNRVRHRAGAPEEGCQRLVRLRAARRQRMDRGWRALANPGQFHAACRSRFSHRHWRRLRHRPQCDAARLPRGGQQPHRDGRDRAQWRQDRALLSGRRRRAGDRGQGVPGPFADRRRPRARDPHGRRGGGAADRERRRQLRQALAALRGGPQAHRIREASVVRFGRARSVELTTGLERALDPPPSHNRAKHGADAEILLALALLACVIVIGLATVGDYGITTDEFNADDYGSKALAWYTSGFTDRSSFESVEDTLWYYGPWFHILTALAQSLGVANPWTIRHAMTFLI